MNWRIVRLLFLLTFVLLFPSVNLSPHAQQLVSSTLAFSSDRDGDFEIYLIAADGSNLTQLTSNDHFDGEPAWSPDGSRIAFVSDRDGNYELYIMNADGSGQQRLTNNNWADHHPSWSPDSSQIVFQSDASSTPSIYLLTVDRPDEPRPITSDAFLNISPIWSPDGSRIAYTSERDGQTDAFVISLMDGTSTQVTNTLFSERVTDWSPDGSQLLLQSDHLTGERMIIMADVFRGDQRTLIESTNFLSEASFSPDGTQIAVVEDVSPGNSDIVLYDLFGRQLGVVSGEDTNSFAPAWLPEPGAFNGSYRGLWAAFTGHERFGAVAIHENGEQLIAMTETDANGQITRVTGAIWTSPDGQSAVVYLGNDGLPETAIVGEYRIEYSDYTTDTVTVTLYDPVGFQIQSETVNVDPEALREMRLSQFSRTTASFGKLVQLLGMTLAETLRFAGVALNTAMCVAGVIASGPLAPLTAVACGTLVLRVAVELLREETPLLAATGDGLGMGASAILCGAELSIPDCALLAIDIGGGLAAALEADDRRYQLVPTVTPSPLAPTATPRPQPCVVTALAPDSVAIRVGPGTNRSVVAWMPAGVPITVLGYAEANDGSLWWRVDKSQAAPQSAANETWVAQFEVVTNGDCSVGAVQSVSAPPIIRIVTRTNTPAPTSASPTGRTPTPTVTPASGTGTSSGVQGDGTYTSWFRADDTSLSPGECTYVRWDLEGIDSVYYQGRAAVGHSESFECPSATTTYELRIVLRSGQTVYQYVTLEVGGGPAPGGGTVLGTGDVQITLRWNNAADLDLHVIDPFGEEIYFGDRNASSGGTLDVDSNYPCGSNQYFVENVYWPTGGAPRGTYQVYVTEFSLCGAGSSPSWTLSARVDGVTVLQRTGTGSSSTYSFTR